VSIRLLTFQWTTLFLFAFSSALWGQKLNYFHYTREVGLAGNVAYCISQDKDGFIWIGTENGACRFDGYTFKNYTVEDGLTDNEVLEVLSDSKGRTWFVCHTGAVCYYFKGQIYNSKNDVTLQAAPKVSDVMKLMEDPEGNIWIGGAQIGVYTADNKFLIVHEEERGIRQGNTLPASLLLADTVHGGAMIAIHGILYNYKITTRRKTGLFSIDATHYPDILSFPSFSIRTADADRLIIAGTNHYTLIQLYRDKNPQIIKSVSGVRINKVVYDKSWKECWVASSGRGAFRVDADLNRTSDIYFAEKKITDVITDRTGNIWFTSINDGVFMISCNRIFIYNHASGLSSDNIVAVTTSPDGNLLSGTYDGAIQKFADNRFTTLNLSGNYHLNGGLKNIKVGEGIYLAQHNEGIHAYPATAFKNLEGKSLGAVKSVSIKNKKAFYLANHNGLFAATDSSLDTLKMYERFTSLSNIRNDLLWAASVKHLYAVKGNLLQILPQYEIEKYGRVIDLYNDNSGMLWIATYSNGVYIWNRNKIIPVGKSQGLASGQCRSLCRQNDSTMWVVTNFGISSMIYSNRRSDIKVNNYDESDGIPSCYIYQLACCNDTLWLATDKGLVTFALHKLKNDIAFPVQITGAKQNDASVNLRNFHNNLNSGGLQISYTAISFNSNKETVFYYRLKGLDQQWHRTNQRQIEYASLSPGDYTFLVYAIDKNRNKSMNTASLEFSILPFWWQTWWFRTMCVLLIILSSWRLVNRRIKKIKLTEKEKLITLRNMNELKLEAIRSQINPHFIFNSLNSIQNYLVNHDTDSASGYLNDFSRVIRKSLKMSLNNFISLEEEVELLSAFLKLEKMRFADKFDFTIHVKDIPADIIYVPSLIFQHYAENAVKHGLRGLRYKGIITIEFYSVDNRLHCVISDNGKGLHTNSFTEPEYSTGLGLRLHTNRTELLNLLYNINITINISSKVDVAHTASGTRVEIAMPLLKYSDIALLNTDDK
jgi:ligand-binding sensor domain-containing protein